MTWVWLVFATVVLRETNFLFARVSPNSYAMTCSAFNYMYIVILLKIYDNTNSKKIKALRKLMGCIGDKLDKSLLWFRGLELATHHHCNHSSHFWVGNLWKICKIVGTAKLKKTLFGSWLSFKLPIRQQKEFLFYYHLFRC